ncbi:MAG: LacI family transcriptional regulator [Spirochaetaceae bacterium]|nr:MAG: LacI family transcriptional regulator [Spirochaetaceae bacterium]
MEHVPLKDIAQATGVSVSTVSRVMTHHPGISEATRSKVLAAAREMRYSPHGAARSLSTNKSMTVAFLSYRRPVSTQLVTASSDQSGVLEVLEAAGYSLLIAGISDDELRKPRELRILRQQRVDGLILEGPTLSAGFVQELVNMGMPVVHVDGLSGVSGLDIVLHENERGAEEITHHLVRSSGRKRIVFISGPSHWISSAERRRGYENAMRAHELEPRVIMFEDTTTDIGVEAARTTFEKYPDADAIVAVNDAVAIGFIGEARRLGVNVPHDMAVTGFDDISWAAHSHPTLTTMRTFPSEMGRQAATRLLELLSRPGEKPAPLTIRVGVELVRRESCGTTDS